MPGAVRIGQRRPDDASAGRSAAAREGGTERQVLQGGPDACGPPSHDRSPRPNAVRDPGVPGAMSVGPEITPSMAPQRARDIAATFDLRALPPDFYANPYPVYKLLRETEPVKRMPDG